MKPIKIFLILTTAFFLGACAIKPVPERVGPAYELFSRAEKMFQAKFYEKALADFNEYLARFPDGFQADAALMNMGSIHTILGKYQQARNIYQRLIDDYAKSHFVSDARFEILVAYYNDGDYGNAIEQATDYLKYTASRVHVLKTYLLLGDIYNAMGSSKDAVNYYNMALNKSEDTEKKSIVEKLKDAVRRLESQDIVYLIGRVKDDIPKAYLMFQMGLSYAEEEKYDEALKALSVFAEKFSQHENVQQAQKLMAAINKQSVYSRHTIGCLLPLSGSYQIYGNRALKGIQLAFNQFNVLNPRSSLKIIVKDTASDPVKAATAVKELLEENVAAIIGPVVTAGSAAKEAQNYGIPIITLTQKDNIPEIGEYVFRNFITPDMQVKALVSYAIQELGVRDFAILYPDEKYGKTFMALFWDEVIAHEGKVVGVEPYKPDGTDFADPIKKLVGLYYEVPEKLKNIDETLSGNKSGKTRTGNILETQLLPLDEESESFGTGENDKPEAIVDFGALFIPDAPKKSGLIVPQLAYYDVKDTYLLGTNLWHSENLIEMTRQYVQGAIMPDGFFAGSKMVNVRQFVDGFYKIFNENPGFMEAAAYDTALIMFQTVSRPDVRYRSAIKNELKRLTGFQGVTGLTSFEWNGDARKNLYLLRIRGQRFVELEQR
jgi:ABC-type branched-subunit amino acid transport system substrate-binding protein/predicted negative regulator of RcsB-dependent stress response